VTLSDGRRAELKPGGARLPVTFQTRLEYAALAERARLLESEQQLQLVRRGMCALVPEQLLLLFGSAHLEQRVCGRPFVDVALLRRHTEYAPGVKESDAHIGFFWRVLEEWSHEERRRFIKFAWAQERLPSTDEEFKQGGHTIRLLIKEKAVEAGKSADHIFPKADTCFFNLELPRYSSLEVMREKLGIVINLSSSMDADEQAAAERDASLALAEEAPEEEEEEEEPEPDEQPEDDDDADDVDGDSLVEPAD
jgi:other hect domain ubiquitin protein ligase E3